jgi:hypothetical protein
MRYRVGRKGFRDMNDGLNDRTLAHWNADQPREAAIAEFCATI